MAGEDFWIDEVPVTGKCIFHQELTFHPQLIVSSKFLPLQSRGKLFPTGNVFQEIYSHQ